MKRSVLVPLRSQIFLVQLLPVKDKSKGVIFPKDHVSFLTPQMLFVQSVVQSLHYIDSPSVKCGGVIQEVRMEFLLLHGGDVGVEN